MNRYRVRGTTRDGQAIPMSDTPLGDLAAMQRAVGFHEARGSTVRIFKVAEDGAETMLPTYEEALAEIARARTAGTLVAWHDSARSRGWSVCVADADGTASDDAIADDLTEAQAKAIVSRLRLAGGAA